MFSSGSQNENFPCIEYRLQFSLKSLALVKVATVLSDRLDVKIKAWDFCLAMQNESMYKKRKEWIPIEEVVISKGTSLHLPVQLKQELVQYCSATSWELFLWLNFHIKKCNNIIPRVPDRIIWKPHGIIDRKETAVLLVKDTTLDLVARYKLACLYCLKSDIIALWNQLHDGKNFRNTLRNKNLDALPLVSYWSHHVAGKLKYLRPLMIELCCSDNPSPYEYAFRISVNMDNEVAVRYFFTKLNSEEKDWLLLDTIKNVLDEQFCFDESYPSKKHTGILYFFLQVLDEQKQSDLFHLDPCFVFLCFLDWPFQSLFIKVVQQWNSYLSETVCHYILEAISTRANMGCKDYDYQELYRQFWHSISPSYKKYIINEGMDEAFLLHLFDLGDRQNIALLFEEMPIEDRESFIFSEEGESLCKRLIFSYQFEVLKFFILLCISTRKSALKFRKMMIEWQLEEEDINSSEDGDSSNDEDNLNPGEGYILLGQAIETMDELLTDKYKKRRKEKDAHKSTKKPST